MIDGRDLDLSLLDQEAIQTLCHRRFGVGADGLIILERSKKHLFAMKYYNSDGREGSMCGNGGRCIVAFARQLGLAGSELSFESIDGTHRASFLENGEICLKLRDVQNVKEVEDGYLLDTGSPHFVRFVKDLNKIDMEVQGRVIRHESRFGEEGVNVNFVEEDQADNSLFVRTFERGVEAETWSCGTGVTAAAIAACFRNNTDKISYKVLTRGGRLEVRFKVMEDQRFAEVELVGPASHVYDGTIQTGD